METIRVIIVDEQPLFREGIRAALERMGDCLVIGESIDATDILELARTGKAATVPAGANASSVPYP